MAGRILVVADAPEMAAGLAATPADEGYTPALVLLDVMMPGRAGAQLRRRMQAHPRTARPPVVFSHRAATSRSGRPPGQRPARGEALST